MLERIQHLLRKEFIQILRDPKMKMVLFIAPMIQLLIFGYAVSTDVKNIPTAVYDLDNTQKSREIIREFAYSKYFIIKAYINTDQQQKELIDKSVVNTVIRINRGYAEDLERAKPAAIQLILDGTDSNTAGIVLQYANKIIEKYSSGLLNSKLEILLNGKAELPSIDLRARAWFNKNLESRNYFVPGIIALLLLIISILLTAMSIVKEKELGTIEQLIVSPIKSYELIIGKLLPFAIISLTDVFLITTLAVFWFRVPIQGSILLLFGASCLYLLNTLGAGLFISTRSKTQQEAMMSTFFIALPAVLLSGFVFPIANMPKIVQYLTYLNPLRYYIIIIRGIFLKGSGINILWPQMAVLLAMGTAIITISSLLFQKRLD